MELYVGLDVSLKETSICVVDGRGEIVSVSGGAKLDHGSSVIVSLRAD
jgi:hypothetical protein